MPCHPDRVRQNYCEHEFVDIFGYGVLSEFINESTHKSKLCVKCNLIVKSEHIIDNILEQ